MKKLMCVVACIMMLSLSACSNSYKRDTNPGQDVVISVAEMKKKIEHKDSFAIVFTQTTCTHCIAFHKMLDSYILYHNITLYEVVLDEASPSERKADLKTIQKTFPGMDQTPSLFYVKDGKKDDTIIGDIGSDEFDKFVVKHQLDKKVE